MRSPAEVYWSTPIEHPATRRLMPSPIIEEGGAYESDDLDELTYPNEALSGDKGTS